MHRVFISYHHENDQWYKKELVRFAEQNEILIDQSVPTGDISDDVSDEYIRELIRDEYLRDSTVTIVLVGTETARRKHVDWEIYSSMYDGRVNKKSGILAIELPSTNGNLVFAPHGQREKALYPDITSWLPVSTKAEFKRRHPYMPDRLIDNSVRPEAKISVVPWSRINDVTLRNLVEVAFRDRAQCEYDLSRRMRRANS